MVSYILRYDARCMVAAIAAGSRQRQQHSEIGISRPAFAFDHAQMLLHECLRQR
jgi:hypothetical protein